MLQGFELLTGLSDSQLNQVDRICQSRTYPQGETFFCEGDMTDDIYFLKLGKVGLYKIEPGSRQPIRFRTMEAGESFGEMSFADGSPRSCSIKAETECEVYVLSKQLLLDNTPTASAIIQTLTISINRQVSNYLRYLNEEYISVLQMQIDELEERNRFGAFLLVLLIGLVLSGILTAYLNDFLPEDIAISRSFNWAYLLLLALAPSLIAAHYMKVPIIQVIFTTQNWKCSLLDGAAFSAVGALLIYIVCIIADLISGQSTLTDRFVSISWWNTTLLIYSCHSYIQEISRAMTQVSVQRFLKDSQNIYAVGVTAVMFSMAHSHLGPIVMVVTLLSSVLFSEIYTRTYNPAGVTITHIFLGYIVLRMIQQ